MILAVMSCASTAFALDGRVDVRGYRQAGGAGDLSYVTENVWENYSLDQRFEPARSTLLQLRYSFRRDNLWSRTGMFSTESRRETHVPFATLTYRGQRLRVGVSGTALRKDTFSPGMADLRDESVTATAWSRYVVTRAEFTARFMDTRTERSQAARTRETNNRVLGFVANVDVTSNDRLRYSLSHTTSEQITLDTETRYLNNILEYRGNHRFDENRGRLSIWSTASRFDQRNTFGVEGARVIITPVWGGLLLDDTPEEQDPLEPDPVPEPLLYDNDLETPTLINIGESAPPVREYGGDYRNVILDLGRPTAVDSMALHVDAPIDFPALIQWRVYVTDDPEGRSWGPALTPDAVTVLYREWELGRQGWEIRFSEPVSHRWVKLVDTKLGVTEPDIFVTELEAFSPPNRDDDEVRSTLNRYRFYGDVRYNIVPDLEVNYTADIYEHRRNDDERDLSGAVHQAGSVWRPERWELSGYYQISTLSGASRAGTDAHTQFLSVLRRFNPKFDSRVSWKRVEDNSPSLDYTTRDLNLDINWYIAPGLWFNQKVGRAIRSDHRSSREARSWVVSSTIRSTPVPTLSIDLRHVDRWVDQDAGTGFTTFSNTELVTRWSILPLVAFDSQVLYQVRDDDDWSARNQLSWTPIPGGSVGMSFNVIDYRDTRVDIEQQSYGAHVNWRVRPNTRMEFGAEYVNITQRGEDNSPYNLYARASLNF